MAIRVTVILTLSAWFVFGLSQAFPIRLLGIRPRQIEGLTGILVSPFLHANLSHLVANTLAFITLAPVFFVTFQRRSGGFAILLYFLSGFGTWLIARPGVIVIGASGFIFSMIGFILMSAWRQENWRYLIAAAVVLFLHGGAFWGLIPSARHISWEGHLAGLVTGVLAARFIKAR